MKQLLVYYKNTHTKEYIILDKVDLKSTNLEDIINEIKTILFPTMNNLIKKYDYDDLEYLENTSKFKEYPYTCFIQIINVEEEIPYEILKKEYDLVYEKVFTEFKDREQKQEQQKEYELYLRLKEKYETCINY